MFEFTTENVLNDLSRVSVVTPTQDKAIPTGGSGLKVKALNTFIVSHMSPVWKQVGTPAAKEKVLITVPAITAGLYRLELVLQLSGSADADYARFDDTYGKPVYFEMNLTGADTVTTVAAKMQKYFNKFDAPASTKGYVVAAEGGKIAITANTEYIRFKGAKIDKFNETTKVYEAFSTAFTIGTPGDAGFGTAWNLLKNLRIPTQVATYITAEDQDERPIVGTVYNQYTFRYEVNRNIHGTGVVGELARSVTTHVFYVLSTLATTFEGLLTTAGASVVSATGAETPVDDLQGSDVVPVTP